MLFNSLEFVLVFLPITLVIYFMACKFVGSRVAISWLIIASLFFYGWWNPNYLFVLLSSLFFNFFLALFITHKAQSKWILTFGVICNLSFLGYFKYVDFFIDTSNHIIGSNFELLNVVLPLAISFFTFQQIAYLVDSYRGEIPQHDFVHYSLFVTFFPQLIAGPIVHHKEMIPQFQLRETFKFNINNFNIGMTIFAIGLFKKLVLADGIAGYANPVFTHVDAGSSVTFFEAWGGALAYSLQLYFDFSGYADMAIGLAKMMNIDLPINFNSPYKSVNIITFWRRWHMTLSRFLKDYLYIPLGGNRKGSKHLNLFLTMLLGGLWHGASFNFVIWGGLHGFYLIINHSWRYFRTEVLRIPYGNNSKIGYAFSVLFTFAAVTFAWVFFRAETLDGAILMSQGMLGMNGISLPTKLEPLVADLLSALPLQPFVFEGLGSFSRTIGFVWIVALLFLVFFMPNSQQLVGKYYLGENSRFAQILPRVRPLLACAIGVAIFIELKLLLTVSDVEFLYFNF